MSGMKISQLCPTVSPARNIFGTVIAGPSTRTRNSSANVLRWRSPLLNEMLMPCTNLKFAILTSKVSRHAAQGSQCLSGILPFLRWVHVDSKQGPTAKSSIRSVENFCKSIPMTGISLSGNKASFGYLLAVASFAITA